MPALLLSMMLLQAAAAPPAGAGPVKTPPPQPTTGPLRYYPEAAWRDGIEGSAVIHCNLTAEKSAKLTDCKVLNEQPAGAGFGEAAMRMSSLFVMRPRMRDGSPVEGEVSIPIRFKLPKR
jgi:TonB family protein